MDADLRRAVNATLMPGFEGPTLPGWLADELAEGLGGVCLFGTNVVDAGQVRELTDAIHAANLTPSSPPTRKVATSPGCTTPTARRSRRWGCSAGSTTWP